MNDTPLTMSMFANKGDLHEARAKVLEEALEKIADFAPGNGDVCEIIAKVARRALRIAGREES